MSPAIKLCRIRGHHENKTYYWYISTHCVDSTPQSCDVSDHLATGSCVCAYIMYVCLLDVGTSFGMHSWVLRKSWCTASLLLVPWTLANLECKWHALLLLLDTLVSGSGCAGASRLIRVMSHNEVTNCYMDDLILVPLDSINWFAVALIFVQVMKLFPCLILCCYLCYSPLFISVWSGIILALHIHAN